MRCVIGHVLGVWAVDSVCSMRQRLQRRLPLMWWRSVHPWIDRAVAPEWYDHWASPSMDGGARRIIRWAVQNDLLVRTRWELFRHRAAAKDA